MSGSFLSLHIRFEEMILAPLLAGLVVAVVAQAAPEDPLSPLHFDFDSAAGTHPIAKRDTNLAPECDHYVNVPAFLQACVLGCGPCLPDCMECSECPPDCTDSCTTPGS